MVPRPRSSRFSTNKWHLYHCLFHVIMFYRLLTAAALQNERSVGCPINAGKIFTKSSKDCQARQQQLWYKFDIHHFLYTPHRFIGIFYEHRPRKYILLSRLLSPLKLPLTLKPSSHISGLPPYPHISWSTSRRPSSLLRFTILHEPCTTLPQPSSSTYVLVLHLLAIRRQQPRLLPRLLTVMVSPSDSTRLTLALTPSCIDRTPNPRNPWMYQRLSMRLSLLHVTKLILWCYLR